MDGPQIDQKIRFGYAKAAQHLGQPFQLYRSAMPINPLDSGNLIGTLPAVMSQDWTWMKSNRPGNAIWFCCIDAQIASQPLAAEEGDYLVGDHVFFVLSIEYQLPLQVMECNRTLNIIRATQPQTAGLQPYAGYIQQDSKTVKTIMTQMPASVLKTGSQASAPSRLPTDTEEPKWIIHLPNLGGVNIRVGDFIIDDINENYVVTTNEETEFGWRLVAQQVVNSGS